MHLQFPSLECAMPIVALGAFGEAGFFATSPAHRVFTHPGSFFYRTVIAYISYYETSISGHFLTFPL